MESPHKKIMRDKVGEMWHHIIGVHNHMRTNTFEDATIEILPLRE